MINKEKSTALYQSILDGNKQREFKYWHASSIAMCPRAHYYQRLGVPILRHPTAAKVIRWSAGHHLETSIREHVEKVWGKTSSNDRMTSEEMQLTGEFDNLVIEGDRLVEIKSVHDMAFLERDGQLTLKENDGPLLDRFGSPRLTRDGKQMVKWKPKTTPYLGHQLQNHAYVLLLKENGVEVKGIDYVYIALGGRMVVYSTDVQQKLIDNVKARLKALNEAWEAKEPPVCICTPKHELWDSVLQWCDYMNEGTKECCALALQEDKGV